MSEARRAWSSQFNGEETRAGAWLSLSGVRVGVEPSGLPCANRAGLGSKKRLGRIEFLTSTIRSEPKGGKRKPTTRAKWRSSRSAYRG